MNTPEVVFTLTVEEAATLNAFLQDRMTDAESVLMPIGLIATKLYHFCRENPNL